jgi:hypothetical protein
LPEEEIESMLPPELQAIPPRDPNTAGVLLANNAANPRNQILAFVLIPVCFVLLEWLKYGIGNSGDLRLAPCLGSGMDAFIGLFVLGVSVQRKRAARLFREGTATTGTVRKVQTPTDGSGAAYGFLQVEHQDAMGRTHTGMFSTLGSRTDMDVSEGDTIPVLHLPTSPRVCAFYTSGMGMVPGRAQS